MLFLAKVVFLGISCKKSVKTLHFFFCKIFAFLILCQKIFGGVKKKQYLCTILKIFDNEKD